MNSLHQQIILGSNSPRRQEILRRADVSFEVWPIEWEEKLPHGAQFSSEEMTMHFAEGKALSVRERLTDEQLLITADTLVFLDGKPLGKPKDKYEACEMLSEIAGKMHTVITGVCLMEHDWQITFSEETKVWMRLFELAEIEYYVDKYAPLDKAGAYGAQDWLGMVGIERIEGSYYNVMGLPIHKVYEHLKNRGEHQ